MAIEAMKSGGIIVNRKNAGDSDFLLSIKYGKISYEELNQIVNSLFDNAEYVIKNQCVLPDRVNSELINELCERIIYEN
jgi:hypothetical protein